MATTFPQDMQETPVCVCFLRSPCIVSGFQILVIGRFEPSQSPLITYREVSDKSVLVQMT